MPKTVLFDHILNDKVQYFTQVLVSTLIDFILEKGFASLESSHINPSKLIEFLMIVLASDVPVYILVFFVELDGKALLCTFNCTEEEMKEWKPVARGIMSSVKITFGEKGEIDI